MLRFRECDKAIMAIDTEFFITFLVVVLIPGTGVIYTVSTGLLMGWRASLFAALGCTLGIVPHVTASILGLSAILHTSALAFQMVKYAGVLYLLYMAWSMWRETRALSLESSGKSKSMPQIAIRGFLINILNPKLSIVLLAFLPLFVSADASSPMMQMIILGLLFMLMTLVVFVLYGISANGVRKFIGQSSTFLTWLQRVFAAIFAILAAKLASTE